MWLLSLVGILAAYLRTHKSNMSSPGASRYIQATTSANSLVGIPATLYIQCIVLLISLNECLVSRAYCLLIVSWEFSLINIQSTLSIITVLEQSEYPAVTGVEPRAASSSHQCSITEL